MGWGGEGTVRSTPDFGTLIMGCEVISQEASVRMTTEYYGRAWMRTHFVASFCERLSSSRQGYVRRLGKILGYAMRAAESSSSRSGAV